MQSTANSLLHTVASAASHDLRVALYPSHADADTTLLVNRTAIVVFGLVGLLMVFYAPPYLLSFLGILGSLASGLVFLMRDRGRTRNVARSLTVRITLSVLLFLSLLLAHRLGWIQPTGVPVG